MYCKLYLPGYPSRNKFCLCRDWHLFFLLFTCRQMHITNVLLICQWLFFLRRNSCNESPQTCGKWNKIRLKSNNKLSLELTARNFLEAAVYPVDRHLILNFSSLRFFSFEEDCPTTNILQNLYVISIARIQLIRDFLLKTFFWALW